MSLPIGARLGPYEITDALGAGGMGEVYRARDTRLGRSVAIKVLPQGIVGASDRRTRFEREARVIASFNHPHICTLHDIGRERPPNASEDIQFLVMELIEGETLAARLSRGRLNISEILSYAIQIADALDRAHREGIVHRDLKPANIMLTRSGLRDGTPLLKLLDFGLARLRSDAVTSGDGQTRSMSLSAPGLIIGTLQYMAPEQLEGKLLDARADVFAFGAILYEMAAGRRPFEADSEARMIAAILQSDPPPLPSTVPASFARIVQICLEKDPANRWSSAHDVLLALRGIQTDVTGSSQDGRSAPRYREAAAWGIAALATIVALGLAIRGRTPSARAPVDLLSIVPAAGTTLVPGEGPQISPDGRHVAFVASDATGRNLLYLRARDTADARTLPGTDEATHPFWSPDSRSLGFFARGALRTISIGGGPPRAIASASVSRGGTWSRDNKILFLPWPGSPTLMVSSSGGPATQIAGTLEPTERRWFPSFLPDGRHYLFVRWATTQQSRDPAVYVGSIDSTEIKELVKSKSSAVYAEPGYLIFTQEGSLMAQAFDAERIQFKGDPVRIADNVGYNPISYQGFFSASNNGALAYVSGDPGWDLIWFDMSGRRLGNVGGPGRYSSMCLSHDGRRVVYDMADDTGNVDLWQLDLGGGSPRRLTFHPAVDFYPVCSPKNDDIMFASARSGAPNLYRIDSSAPGSEIRLTDSAGAKSTTDWSSDGKYVVYSRLDPKTSWDIWVQPTDGGQPFVYLQTEAEERDARLSPDTRWMAYASSQGSGRLEIYVQPFPTGKSSTRWQITTTGGRQPMWSPDGGRLYYLSPDDRLAGLDVKPGGTTFGWGTAHQILEARIAGWERSNPGRPYAISPDGQRFLVSVASGSTRPITLLLNWQNR
jgi:Tol biopolymer transport system component